jgi:hypothetical protein
LAHDIGFDAAGTDLFRNNKTEVHICDHHRRGKQGVVVDSLQHLLEC